MKAAARAPVRSPAKPRRRVGTLLALCGLVAVLGATFTAGALAGRLSLRPAPSNAQATPRGGSATPPAPELTFYRELTAPLAARPVPPKPTARPGKREAPAADAPRVTEPAASEGERRTDPLKPAEAAKGMDVPKAAIPPASAEAARPADAAATNGAPRSEAGRYTIQVGAYNGRAQAEAVRARLLADGHDAYVAEAESSGVTRYKVRIGAFPSADEARKAAARLAARSPVATYITTR